MSLLSKSNNKFIVSIGDEGVIVTYTQDSVMSQRLFANSPTSPELLSLLSSDIDAPIYVLIDIVDQSYTSHTFPPVSKSNAKKMAKRTLEKEYDAIDLKAAINLSKKKSNRNDDWEYLFVSVRYTPTLSDWIETMINLPNSFGGIYLLPIESINFIKDLRAATESLTPKPSKWQLLVTHNRIGGFRQVVFKDGNVLFTRIAQPIGGQTPDVIAGNIEQETLNTIEYIRRLGFEDETGLDIYIVTAAEVKKSIDIRARTSNPVIVLTPQQTAEMLGIMESADVKDRFADVVIASHFANTKKSILKLTTPLTQKIASTLSISRNLKVIETIIIIGLIGLSIYNITNYLSIKDSYSISDKKKQSAQIQLTNAKKKLDTFKGNRELIEENSGLYNMLTKDENTALLHLTKLAQLHSFNIDTSKIELQIEKREDVPNLLKTVIALELLPDKDVKSDIAANLLDKFDDFKEAIKKLFPEYAVSFINPPSENSDYYEMTDESAQDLKFDLVINIDGPIAEEKKKQRRRRGR